ncbi:MAG: hypothetical protein RI944_854 [Actinomycetota bacterium]|jgi:hypothetical protein
MRFRRKITQIVSLTFFQALFFLEPAFAVFRDDGDEPGNPLSGFSSILIFIGVPLLVVAIISLAILAPQWTRKAKLESGFVSHNEKWWLNGPGNEAHDLDFVEIDEKLGKLTPKVGGVSAKW